LGGIIRSTLQDYNSLTSIAKPVDFAFFGKKQTVHQASVRASMLFILPSRFLVADDTCNPLPGFIPTYKTVGYEQSAGCRLYPEVCQTGVPEMSLRVPPPQQSKTSQAAGTERAVANGSHNSCGCCSLF